MDKNEIKKALYKQNPEAKFDYIREGVAYYKALITDTTRRFNESRYIYFAIPVSDMGKSDFSSVMDSKLLIRWIYVFEVYTDTEIVDSTPDENCV